MRKFGKKIVKNLLVLSLAGVLVCTLAGCTDDFDEFLDEEEEISTADAGDEKDAKEVTFSSGGTVLSTHEGELSIDRVTRSSESSMGENNWTLFVYLCGTDLESDGYAGSADFDEMMEGSFGDDVNVIVQTGGTKSWYYDIDSNKIQRYQVVDGDLVLIDESSQASMGDADTLSDFISWGVENYPAEHMGLVFWDHGSGSINGVCFDELYDSDSLTLREIDSALNATYSKMTDKFEFIGFDACLMSTLETANILVPYARYMYASEETEPGSGWNYTEILNYLGKNPDADGASLGKSLTDSYVSSCSSGSDKQIVTFSIVDLAKIDDLIISLNETAKELYSSDEFPAIIKAARGADNFGGNNNSEGYTNMVDIGDMLNCVSPYSANAENTLSALDSAVIYNKNGKSHSNSKGLSIYYPLSVQGSSEISTFSSICPCPYYMGIVHKSVYGTEYGNLDQYDGSQTEDVSNESEDIWEEEYDVDDVSTNQGENQDVSESNSLYMLGAYIDDEGYFTVAFDSLENLYTASCSLYMSDGETAIYVGSVEEVYYDDENALVQDNFDGMWPSLGDCLLPLDLADYNDTESIYTCPVLVNGERTNLRILYDWNDSVWEVLGTWDGIDEETGMSSRDTYELQDGDVIEPIYYVTTGGDWEEYRINSYTVNGTPEIEYGYLDAGDYYYSFNFYDIYGNIYYSPSASLSLDDEGTIQFELLDDEDYGDGSDY